MKKSSIPFLALLLFVSLSGFSPVQQNISKSLVSKTSGAVFFEMTGPTVISANGGPYIIKATNIPYSPNGVSLFHGNRTKGEQVFIFPDVNGNVDIEVFGASFSTLRGFQTIWIEDEYGSFIDGINVFVTD